MRPLSLSCLPHERRYVLVGPHLLQRLGLAIFYHSWKRKSVFLASFLKDEVLLICQVHTASAVLLLHRRAPGREQGHQGLAVRCQQGSLLGAEVVEAELVVVDLPPESNQVQVEGSLLGVARDVGLVLEADRVVVALLEQMHQKLGIEVYHVLLIPEESLGLVQG